MKSHSDIAEVLRNQLMLAQLTQAELSSSAGVSRRTLTQVLSGQQDFKVSTLFALADRLGLELVLVPKAVAGAVSALPSTEPVVKSRIQQALENLLPPK
jgi:transcriptional regulator with XRE-family HTH domain